MMSQADLWKRYQAQLVIQDGFMLDVSRMDLDDVFFQKMAPLCQKALSDMDALEKGSQANPDEKRMVGHYWLRDADRAPDPTLKLAITAALRKVHQFTADVHAGRIKPTHADRFRNVLVVGIGGSALGPQLVADALGSARDVMQPYFFDNTDPDGMDRVIQKIGAGLRETLTVVISKSGGTKETRNGMLEAAAAYKAAGLSFAKHAVAVTGDGSELDKVAISEGWLTRFPMWDWVGGRTSELAAVGLLPAALQGIDIDGMLAGAREMDGHTRNKDATRNPALLLALAWHKATGGKGERDMVILPYKDRLLLMSRYLQQLVMESLGKEKDLDGKTVHQGIAVYGNKGSTDQHAYVQQLRDGVANFFATFIEVKADRPGGSMEVEPGVTSGDYLLGFLLGTRRALYEGGRPSITVTLDDVSARTVGMLIALYERAVGFYASLVNINAYHQPGVEAGKKAAAAVLALQKKAIDALQAKRGQWMSAEQVASAAGSADEVETVYKVLEHLAFNGRGVVRSGSSAPAEAKYQAT